MNIEGRKTAQGNIEILITMTQEDFNDIQAEAAEYEKAEANAAPSSEPDMQLLGFKWPKLPKIPNPFKRKATYCVTCKNGQKHQIEAYGDIHAGIIAFGICGEFSMHVGRCP